MNRSTMLVGCLALFVSATALGQNPGFSASAPGGDADGHITLLLAHGELVYGVDGTEIHVRQSDGAKQCAQPQLIFEP